MAKRSLFLINRRARNGRLDREKLIAPLHAAGLELIEESANSPGEVTEIIRRHRDRVELVIVGGGDGALNAASDGLAECRLPLGILPLGTANDLARTLGIPTELQAAGQVIADGHVKR